MTFFTPARVRALLVLIAASMLVACEQHPGRLVVVVRTDFAVPAQMSELVVRVARTDGTSMEEVPFTLRAADAPDVEDGSRTMPLSFAIHPREPGTEVEISLIGLRPTTRTPIVTRRAVVGFVPGSTRVLDMFLAQSCSLDVVVCDEERGQTCIDGQCVEIPRVDALDLPTIENPGQELLDGGATATDAGPPDAALFDASVDASSDSAVDAGSDGGVDAGSDDAGELDAGDGGCTLDVPSPLSPENGTAVGRLTDGVRPRFVWSASCGASSYEIEVDDSCTTPGFASCAFPSPEATATGLTATSHQPATALPVSSTVPVGRRYYWRVRACAGATCSAWSAVRYLDVGRAASDLDGDGWPEVVVGARGQDTNAGAVYVHRGGASGLAAGVELDPGHASGDHYGGALGYAGDVNGDGFGDLIVGAPDRTNPERTEGNAFVYLGSASGLVVPGTVLDNPDDDASGQFGWAVSGLGDVNADGYADVAVGAVAQDGLARDSGRVWVYLGSASGIAATPSLVIDTPGAEMGARFGHAVRGVGDVNGDGFGDLVAGAPFHDAGARDSGAAFLYLGSATGVATTPAVTFTRTQTSAQFGTSMIGADLNGDGYDDVVVGATYYTAGASAEGSAFVYYGGPAGVPSTPDLHLDNPVNDANAWFGDSVGTLGDLNADGFDDLVVGALFANAPENDEGNAYVYFGSAAGIAALPNVTLDNPTDSSTGSFGISVASAGDVNGDGIPDLVVGAYQQPISGNDEGAVYVFFGGAGWAATTPDATLVNPIHQATGRYGYAVAPMMF